MSYVNTGRQIVGTLRQVAVDIHGTRTPTGITKPNDVDDPDYIAPLDNVDSHTACPIPAIINYDISESAAPYVDDNLQIKQGVTIIVDAVATESGSVTVSAGSTIHFEAYTEQPSTGTSPILQMVITRDTGSGPVEIYNSSTPAIVDASLTYSTTAIAGAIYSVTVTGVATALACGVDSSYSGGPSFPTQIAYNLGTGLGIVTLDYDMLSVPDKAEVWFDGVKVIDTGYRGDSSYQSALDAELTSLGQPTETIAGVGLGNDTFTKSTTTSLCIVKVFGPLTGTAWSVQLSCPV